MRRYVCMYECMYVCVYLWMCQVDSNTHVHIHNTGTCLTGTQFVIVHFLFLLHPGRNRGGRVEVVVNSFHAIYICTYIVCIHYILVSLPPILTLSLFLTYIADLYDFITFFCYNISSFISSLYVLDEGLSIALPVCIWWCIFVLVYPPRRKLPVLLFFLWSKGQQKQQLKTCSYKMRRQKQNDSKVVKKHVSFICLARETALKLI